jgi:hypothetical protein
MFGYKIILLGMLDPAGCLSFQDLENKEPCQGGVVSMQVKFFSVEVFLEVFQLLHNNQWLLLCHTVVPFSLGEGPAVVSYCTLLPLLRL